MPKKGEVDNRVTIKTECGTVLIYCRVEKCTSYTDISKHGIRGSAGPIEKKYIRTVPVMLDETENMIIL